MMVFSTERKFSSPFSSTEIKEAPGSQNLRSPVRRRLNFSIPPTIQERIFRSTQEILPQEKIYVYIPTSSESSDDSDLNRLIISEMVREYVADNEVSTSETESDRGYEIKRKGRFALSLSKVKSLGNSLHSSAPFDKDSFVKEQTSEFYKQAFQILLSQDSGRLTRVFNTTPSFAVDALICFYYHEKRIKGDDKRKLEKFLIEECFERMRDIPLKKRCALFQFLYEIATPFHTSTYALGRCYAVGFGTRCCMAKAKTAFYHAANRGDSQSQFILGGICEFINANNIQAASQEDRDKEAKRCYAEAARWYLAAHNNGLTSATFALACCYSSGIGVSKNLKMAFDLCRQAVLKRVLGARFLISILYREGPEDKKNVEKSIKWCFKGIKYGEADFQAIYGLFSELENVQITENDDNCCDFKKRVLVTRKRLRVLKCVALQEYGQAQKKYWENKKEFPQEIGSQQNEERRQFFLKKLMGLSKN